MSAQVIQALVMRADQLDARANAADGPVISPYGPGQDTAAEQKADRRLASEFRQIASLAQSMPG